MKLLIRGGRVIDPAQNFDKTADVLIENGLIAAVESAIKGHFEEVYEARGKIVAPGLIDPHVHLREPGREDKETIATCAKAAARGGFTTIVGMPNTTPQADNQTVIEFVKSKAAQEAVVDVFQVGNITKGGQGRELAEIGELSRSGVIALSDDGSSIMNADVMNKALEYAKMFGLLFINHSEDVNLAGEWAMNEGRVSTRLGLPGKSALAEEVMIARDLMLAEEVGVPIHFTHVNTARSVKLIQAARERGVAATCDTCPHYFSLSEEAVDGYNSQAKMNPPLRPEVDVEAMKVGLGDGLIDAIGSDHAPHLLVEKYREFTECANGIVGLETSLPLAVTKLVGEKYLDWPGLIQKMSLNPAKILGLSDRGSLAPGKRGDLTVIDPKRKEVVDKNKFESKGRNTPFDGWELTGAAVLTVVAGRVVMKDREGR